MSTPASAKDQVARLLTLVPYLHAHGEVRVDEAVTGPDADSVWDRLVLERGSLGLADEVLGYGGDVYVEEPAELRDRVVARLLAAVGAAERL